MFAKKGGEYRLTLEDVMNGDTFVIPAGMKVESVISKTVHDESGNMAIGSGPAGQHLVANVAVPSDTVVLDHTVVAISTYTFSLTTDKTMTVTLPTDAVIDLYVTMQKVN
jgi:hypothetical protein